MMRRLVFAVISASISISATNAQATVMLDQLNDVSPSATADSTSGGVLEQGQTFKVGVTGTLAHIDVQLNWPGFGSTGNAILNLYNTSAGLPTGASLGTASLTSFLVPSGGYAFQKFDLSAYGIHVQAGDVLAYGISSDENVYFFERSTFDHSTYTGGQSVWRTTGGSPGPWTEYSPTHDGGFETYVDATVITNRPGDFNNNGIVDAADYVIWRDHLGEPAETPLNGNGDGQHGVDQGDYALWRANFTLIAAPAAAATVPEPASSVLLLAAIACAKAATPRRSRA